VVTHSGPDPFRASAERRHDDLPARRWNGQPASSVRKLFAYTSGASTLSTASTVWSVSELRCACRGACSHGSPQDAVWCDDEIRGQLQARGREAGRPSARDRPRTDRPLQALLASLVGREGTTPGSHGQLHHSLLDRT